MSEPFEATIARIAGECLAVRARLLNRGVSGIYDDALRPLKLRVSQMNVLVAVAKAGEIGPTRLGRLLRIEKSTLSRNVERLRSRGWIDVSECDGGRVQSLRITLAGRRLIQRAVPLWLAAQQRTLALLGEAGVEALRRASSSLWRRA